MKLGIKAYNTNCLIYAEDECAERLAIEYSADICEGYSTDIFCEKCREDIVDQFPEAENIDDVLMTILIYCDPFCSDVWYIVEDYRKAGSLFQYFYKDEHDAFERAQFEWEGLTESERDKVEYFRVVKTTICDPNAENFGDGEVVKELK